MKNITKKYTIIVLLSLILFPLASAEFLACFTKGQMINYCNPKVQDRTCASDYGCTLCMKSYNSTEECYSQGNYNTCNHIAQKCTVVNGTVGFDFYPPQLTISSPSERSIYNKKSIFINLSINELSNVYYTDLNKKVLWKNICKNCVHFANEKSFNDGLNRIMFKVEDTNSNIAYYNLSFIVDTKKPRILSVIPRSGLVSGDFKIQFMEENPLSLTMEYGTEQQKKLFMINLSKSCSSIKGKFICNATLNLSEFNGKEIYYKLNLTDIAFNSITTRPVYLDVDTLLPKIISLNYNVSKKVLDLNLVVNESNLEKISYMVYNSSIKTERQLCSSLKAGVCSKKILLQKEGQNTIELIISDKAKNTLTRTLSVFV